jgi:hypothetical protein
VIRAPSNLEVTCGEHGELTNEGLEGTTLTQETCALTTPSNSLIKSDPERMYRVFNI